MNLSMPWMWWKAGKEARRQKMLADREALDRMSEQIDSEQLYFTKILNFGGHLTTEQQFSYESNEHARIQQHRLRARLLDVPTVTAFTPAQSPNQTSKPRHRPFHHAKVA